MRSFLKRYRIVEIVFLILSPLAVLYSISFLCAKAGFLANFPMPIQDCEMTIATLKGSVIDTQGNPIPNAELYFENSPVDNSTPVKQTVGNDESGHFGPKSIHFFKCEAVNFTIKATGFREKRVSYVFDLLPSELTITLERSS